MTKPCAFCGETISTVAKVCPRCRQWQTLLSLGNPATVYCVLIFVVCAAGVALLAWFDRIVDPGPDFALFRDSLTVVESKPIFYDTEKETRLRTLVVLTNNSAIPWKDIELEARFFDKERRLIDARTITIPYIIFGYDELAVAVESTPCRPQLDYSSHRVLVRAARSSYAWP